MAGKVTWKTTFEATSIKFSLIKPTRFSMTPKTSIKQIGPVIEAEKVNCSHRDVMNIPYK